MTAFALAEQLKAALTGEIANAREERGLLRALDGKGLLERSARRQQFNTTAAALERQLVAALNATPLRSIDLTQALSEVRSLAAALGELDVLNHHLAERSLKIVRGYTNAVAPKPAAYDRLGRTGT